MPPESNSIGEGIFFRPNAEEAEIIWEAVRAADLEENGEGVLRLLLLLLEEGGESFLKNPMFRYFKAHPEELQQAKMLAAQGLRTALGKFFKRA